MRPQYKTVLILFFAMFLLAFCASSGHMAFTVSMFAIPLGLAKTIEQVAAGLKKQAFSAVRLVSFTLITFAGPMGLYYVHYAARMSAAPVIAKLDQYYQNHGHYPESLTELAETKLPTCSGTKMFYWTSEAHERFTLGCVSFAFNKYLYQSETEQWGALINLRQLGC
ncbi:hypothetical protein [Motilimonas sp. KMU-193]|uniref:hypothetical protein n=1 Tax=Motilimonas sp. KMU-193 TaxID=3388668 RepID=UPI00396B241B